MERKNGMNLDEAIQMVKEVYVLACDLPYIKNPLAFALYSAWMYVDKGKKYRKEENEHGNGKNKTAKRSGEGTRK
jgi:hypothetical protein